MDIKRKLKEVEQNVEELRSFYLKIRQSSTSMLGIRVLFFRCLAASIFRKVGGTGTLPAHRESLVIRLCEKGIESLKRRK